MTNKLVVKANQQIAIRHGIDYQADYVQHLQLFDIIRLLEVIKKERDKLLIKLIFDGCLRVSEGVSIRPQDLFQDAGGWQVSVFGKGGKRSTVAISASLAAQLQAYAYQNGIKPDDRLFPITRGRVFQIVQKALYDAGLTKPDGVGAVHLLRHSGAIARLAQTGNPKALQEQLRHKSASMTMRYLKTLGHIEAMKDQEKVDYKW